MVVRTKGQDLLRKMTFLGVREIEFDTLVSAASLCVEQYFVQIRYTDDEPNL